MTDDAELLRRYAENRDEGAFAELVRRRLGLVYHAALRQCGGDAHRAEDVAQAVFTDLARKAAQLARRPVLAGWLHTSTRYAASQAVRTEARRQAREQEARAMSEIFNRTNSEAESVAEWERLRPVIDDALHALGERDREAVLLRFFEGRAFADIGAEFFLSEDAARMRVERALDKLRAALVRRGITSTAAALGVALANQAAATAPAGIVASVTGAALAGAAVSGGAGAWVTFLTMSKIKVGIVSAIIVAVAATGVVELRANRELRAELGALRGASDDAGRLQGESQQLNAVLQKFGANNPEVAELTRLRSRIEQLRARPDGVVDSAFKPIANIGRATPQDAYVTFASALNAGDLDAVASLVTFRDDTKESRDAFMASFSEAVRARYRTPERLFAAALFGIQEGVAWPDPAVTFQLMSAAEDHEPGVMRVRLWIHQAGGRESEIRDAFQRTAEGWALVFRPLSNERTAAEIRARIDPLTGAPKPAPK